MKQPALALNAWLRYDLVRRALDRLGGTTLLEVGVGGGALGARLAQRYEYVGLEPDAESVALAHRRLDTVRRGRVINGDINMLDNDQQFDIVCAFEVLEHIADDRGALRRWSRHVRPGGAILISVPAFQHRFGAWDEKVGHLRRYERDELSALFEDVGLDPVFTWSYGFPLGLLLERARNFVARRQRAEASVDQRTAASGRQLQPSDSFAWLTRVGSAPFRLAQRPFVHRDLGIGFVACGRLPT